MAPSLGHFVLHSSVLPPVTAGDYKLSAEHSGLPFDAHTDQTHVTVTAPRFKMPTDQILSTFPPANADGAFGDRLPQIVLKRRTLPWERNPSGEVDVSETPWLALVVVAEGEAELSEPRPVAECVTPGVSLLNPNDTDTDQAPYLAVTQTVLDKIFPTEDDLALLTHVREVDVQDTELAGGDDDGWLAVVLANRLPVLDDDNQQPVRYLACLVNLEGQLDSLPEPSTPVDRFAWELAADYRYLASTEVHADAWVSGGDGLADPVDISVVDGPAAASDAATASGQSLTSASLPEVGAALDGALTGPASASPNWSVSASATAQISDAAMASDAASRVRDTMGIGFHLPIEVAVAETVYRFPVMAHWSFTTSEGATFETLMQGLDVGLMGTKPEISATEPPKPEGSKVQATGHVQLDHTTRRGDSTAAWYRGPFVPHPVSILGKERLALAHSADQLRAIVPDGFEDLGLASAFEIGRLLALSQLSVTADLLRFRREHFGAARIREIVRRYVPLGLDNNALDNIVDLGHLVSTVFVDSLATDPVRVVGPRRPIADPGRPIEELADLSQNSLDKVIATGLGIDYDVLLKQSDAVGVVAALSETAVPVEESTDFGQAEVNRLRASLTTEVVRLATMAAPTSFGLGNPGMGGSDRSTAPIPGAQTDEKPPTDSIDELLARLEHRAEPEGEDD